VLGDSKGKADLNLGVGLGVWVLAEWNAIVHEGWWSSALREKAVQNKPKCNIMLRHLLVSPM
jgi:hypothetical protein